MRWTAVGIAVGIVVLVGAAIAAVVIVTGDDGDGDDFDQFNGLMDARLMDATGVVEVVEIGDTDRAASRASTEAEQDDDPSLPGTFVVSQGRGHFQDGWFGHVMTRYCDSVARSEIADGLADPPPIILTPISPGAPEQYVPDRVGNGGSGGQCYASNPPSSGQHLGVQRNVDIGGGIVINIPPDPDVYPDDVEIPRDAIPHVLEHAGVFVGYHCAEGDAGCEEFVAEVEDVVNQRIDEFDDRVVMARDRDLPVGEIGLAAWTRVLNVRWDEAELDEIEEFISVHSCRFDPEGFC